MPKARSLLLAPLSVLVAGALTLGAFTVPAGAATPPASPPVSKACTYVKLSTMSRLLKAPTKQQANLLDKTPFRVIGCTYTAKKAKPARFFTIAYYPEAGIASTHTTALGYLMAIQTRAGKAASTIKGLGTLALDIQGGIDIIVATKKGWLVAIDGFGPTPNLKLEKSMLSAAIKPFS